ncbi:myopalladin-like [Panthera leo]|uniref:myopalladin-like n=1 Tax=Panthera leo TaxID=9689 RepID=UPI001C699ED5|nr:myopalladin-like [Panthera leo]
MYLGFRTLTVWMIVSLLFLKPDAESLQQPVQIHLCCSPCVHQDLGEVKNNFLYDIKHLQDISTTSGQSVTFECHVQAITTVQIHWHREKKEIADSEDFQILRRKEVCTLIITEAFPEDSGEFKCIAQNEAGTAVSKARLFVSPERKVEKPESSPKLLMRKLSSELASFPWNSDSYTKDKNVDDTPMNTISTIPQPASHNEQEIQVPKEDFCNENSTELQPQW